MLKLAHLANNLHKQNHPISTTLVAVVTDATRPLYRQKEDNYIVMLKVVDESLNDQQLFGVMSKDCTVYLISKKKKDINFIKTVGEIVILDRFTFSLWSGIKLETKYLNTTEGIYTVGIDSEKNVLEIKDQLASNPQLLEITPTLTERVKFLMNWRSTCFPMIYEPKLGISILNSHCVMVEPFNMILRYEGKMDQLLVFKDTNNNSYKARHEQAIQYESGDLVYVRGIGSIGQSMELKLTQTGNILRFSYNVNPNLMNYMAIYRDNQKFLTCQKENSFTLVSCESAETSFLADLIQLQQKYNFTNRKEDIQVRDFYLINAVVINFEGVLSFYHREYQVLLHDGFFQELSQEQKNQYKETNRISYVYEGVLGLFDRSNDAKGKPFYIHLFTSDQIGNFMDVEEFTQAEKSIGTSEESTTRKALQANINRKLKRLSEQSTFTKLVSLQLQPIRSEKLLFRLVNTKIL